MLLFLFFFGVRLVFFFSRSCSSISSRFFLEDSLSKFGFEEEVPLPLDTSASSLCVPSVACFFFSEISSETFFRCASLFSSSLKISESPLFVLLIYFSCLLIFFPNHLLRHCRKWRIESRKWYLHHHYHHPHLRVG